MILTSTAVQSATLLNYVNLRSVIFEVIYVLNYVNFSGTLFGVELRNSWSNTGSVGMPIQLVLGRLVSTHLFLCFLVVFVAFSSVLVCLFVCKFSRCFIFLKSPTASFFKLSLIYCFMANLSVVPTEIHG